MGDKTWSAVFDNTKIKDVCAWIPGDDSPPGGIRRTLAWFEEDKQRQRIDESVNAEMDRILEQYLGTGKMADANSVVLMCLYWTTAGIYPGHGEISRFDFRDRVEAAARPASTDRHLAH